MRTFRSSALVLASMFFSMAAPALVLADSTVRGVLDRSAPAAGLNNACGSSNCVATIVGGLITIVLSLLGVALIGYIVYAGYLWMTAGGEAKRVEQAKMVLRNAVIGIAVIGFSYTLAGVALRFVQNAFNPTPVVEPTGSSEVVVPTTVIEGRLPPVDPLRPGCVSTTCRSECIAATCSTFTSQRRFTCESTCQTSCDASCARPTAPTVSPTRTCEPIADYRQCLANCSTDIAARAARREYTTSEEQSNALDVCNNDCSFLYCTR